MSGLSLSLRSKSRRRIFLPSMVPEVAAGYFWETSAATGLGTSAFKIPEGNGHSSFDLIQATVASQPTLLTEQGGKQFRMRKAGDANPTLLGTAAAVAAGWTGPTWIGMWVRLPDASGDITGTGILFVHTPTAAGQRRLSLTLNNVGDKYSLTLSNDGTATTLNDWASTLVGGGWTWVALAILPGTSAEMSSGFVQLSHVTTAAPVSPLFDGSSKIGVCSRVAANLANVDTIDWSAAYYTNGIPSIQNQLKLANRSNPTGVPLAA